VVTQFEQVRPAVKTAQEFLGDDVWITPQARFDTSLKRKRYSSEPGKAGKNQKVFVRNDEMIAHQIGGESTSLGKTTAKASYMYRSL
jgi:hypothetical protein